MRRTSKIMRPKRVIPFRPSQNNLKGGFSSRNIPVKTDTNAEKRSSSVIGGTHSAVMMTTGGQNTFFDSTGRTTSLRFPNMSKMSTIYKKGFL